MDQPKSTRLVHPNHRKRRCFPLDGPTGTTSSGLFAMQTPDPSALTRAACAAGLVTGAPENVRHAHLVAAGESVHRDVERLEEHVARSHERLTRRKVDHSVLPRVALDEPLRQCLAPRFLFLVEPPSLAGTKRSHGLREQLFPVG